MKIYDVSRLPSSIALGWDGENNWRPIAFDCAALLTGHHDAVVMLWLLPKGETQAFPVALERDGDTVVWTPLNEEMTAERGQLQIVVQDGTDVGKSRVIDYAVHDSLVGGADHPAETPSWAVQVVEDVTDAASRYPRIGDNGNWFVWDTTAGEWVDTGVAAGGGDIDPEDIADAVEEYMVEHPFTESDPTVPAWAKAAQKPSYTAAEVGAMPDSYTPPVTSVNGKTGAVVLDAEDVGALPDSTVIPTVPTKVSELNNDAGYLTAHQSLAAYRTSADQDTIDAAQDTAIAAKYTKPASGIPDSDIASAATWNAKGTYSKPDSGIPVSDLASAVQISLGKADTALQSAPVTSVNGQTGDVVIEASEGTTETDFPSIADIAELWNSVSKLPAGAWEDYAWHQCPEAVRNYIANVDYDGVAYTESSVGTYAPTPAVPATNTKPIGQTVDGVTFYNIRPNSNAPYATANKSGVLNPLDQVRWINSATSNFRDLGGWPCDGGTVKYGLLYRSGNLAAADEDLILNQLGITVECDLTADGEPAYPDKMRFIGHTSYAMYSLANTEAWQVNLRGIFDAVRYGDPVVFHCSMGADRTGTLACILEGLLGVSQSDIDKDYELTSFYAERARNGNYQGGTTDWAHLIAQILALDGETFRDKCVTFVKSLGFTDSEINAYRRAMIDGNPEDIEAPTTTYTVTNTLTGCTTNNHSSSADGGGVYAATITADSGYTLTGATVSITMGGTDITASAYSNGTISIANVTGNIVIAITAAAESSLKELFDPSAATINQRFSSSGTYSALDGNFCSDYIEVNGLDASEPWRIHIKDTTDATRFRASGNNESVLFCKSDKSIINASYGRLAINTNTSGTNTICKHSDSDGGVYIDINQTGDGNYIPSTFFDLSQVAYIRVCMTYSSGTAIPDTATLANISITADKITN